MTRKHFIQLAKDLRAQRPGAWNQPEPNQAEQWSCETWRRCVHAVADSCATFNASFDRHDFYVAAGCTLPSGTAT